MTVQEIVTRVRAAIDELMENGSQFLGQSTDEANLTRVIVDKIGYALQHIIETAPLDRLGEEMIETLSSGEMAASFSIDSDLVGHLILPSSMLRLVEARLSSWSLFPIPEPDTSQAWLMQQDQYARGSWDRPVNIITNTNGHRELLMYCAKQSNDKLQFAYIGRPNLTNVDADHMSTNVSVPAQLQAALVYQVAGLTMVAFREDVAEALFNLAQRYLDYGPNNGNGA